MGLLGVQSDFTKNANAFNAFAGPCTASLARSLTGS